MPKTAMDFSKTVIYHFVCKDTNIRCEYVGSTTNFNQRKADHKRSCHNETSNRHNLKVYQTIREHGGWDNWSMIPLEEFSCENKTQQVIREQFWIDKLKPELNCRASFREGTESEKKKAYQALNSVVIKEKQKAYNALNSDRIKEKKKTYQALNSDSIKDKKKAYQALNSQAIKERKSVKYTCECGNICRINDKARHARSKKHQSFIALMPSVAE